MHFYIVFYTILSTLCVCVAKKEWKVPVPYYGDENSDLVDIWRKIIETEYEYEGYDGWYNNRAHPDWGAADMPMLRKLPHAYADGVYEPSGKNRPNPIEISDAVMSGSTGQGSLRNRTAFLVFFGQQMVEELLDAQRQGCPPEYFNITVPKGHHLNPHNLSDWYIPLLRSRYDTKRTGFSPNNPREQLNEITPWIDGGLMYGVGKAWADSLRAFYGGRLKSTRDDEATNKTYGGKDFPAVNDIRLPMANPPPPIDHYIKKVDRFFRLGNPRGNENPMLLTFGILWYRFHNGVADKITDLLLKAYRNKEVQSAFTFNRSLSDQEFKKKYDEIIFNEARKWVIAVHQKIVFSDWLTSWLHTNSEGIPLKLPQYSGYKSHVHPQIVHEFQSAAMRFGHTLVPPGVYRRRLNATGKACDFIINSAVTKDAGKRALRTCNVYWNPQDPIAEYDIDEMILGMSSQITEKEDNIITPDLRGFVFGGLDFNRRDLMAINIQRGRDHGLPDYKTARLGYGLKLDNFTDINPMCDTEEKINNSADCAGVRGLRRIYNNSLDDIDIWAGGISETTGDGPGPLFRAIISDQLLRIRDADRFWWENIDNGLFDQKQRDAINATIIRQVILAVTNIEDGELAGNPFFYRKAEDKCQITCNRLENENFNASLVKPLCQVGNSSCESIREAIKSANPDMSEFDLNRFADCSNTNLFKTDPCLAPNVINGSNTSTVAECTPLKNYDYFTGSEYSFVFTFVGIGLFLIGCILLMIFCAKRQQSNLQQMRRSQRSQSDRKSPETNVYEVEEWQGLREGRRSIKVKFEHSKKSIFVFGVDKTKPLRIIDCKHVKKLVFKESVDKSSKYLLTKLPDYDLVLVFDSLSHRQAFKDAGAEFCQMNTIDCAVVTLRMKDLLKDVVTKAMRQKRLDKFFRTVFKQAFHIEEGQSEHVTSVEINEITSCELTLHEFAEALSVQPTSMFAKLLFSTADKDQNGYLTFREFLDIAVVFSKGGATEKTKLLFNMYDVSQSGKLSRDEFKNMLKSLMDLAGTSADAGDMDKLVESMFEQAGLLQKKELTYDDFSRLLRDYKQHLDYAKLDFGTKIPQEREQEARERNTVINMKRVSAAHRARNTLIDLLHDGRGDNARPKSRVTIRLKPRPSPDTEQGFINRKCSQISNYVENYHLQIFWVTLYTTVTIAIFAERAYYYSVKAEHGGLRRIAGYGVTITRAAASGMMFTYSTLLLTRCKNLITILRETFFNRYIPFDSAIWFHKYVSYIATVFTIIHIVGHSMNFYHISTQTATDLACIFTNFFNPSHVLPKFHYWCWGTITGLTGVLLTLVLIVMFVFATQYARRHLFRAFWLTHQLYYAFFILMILHGLGMLVQAPILYTFLLGPLVIFTLDKLVSLSRKKTEISIMKAELLPSDVTGLVIKKPNGFEYKSGQWIQVACLDMGGHEYHPFTLTSAPHEDYLSVHIRAVGPWTTGIREICDPNERSSRPYPKLYIDGPFGEGHQDWYKYEVAVLVGGGIGVTPFASILKDIVNKASSGVKVACKKVYFLWVTRSQKQFEWFVDIIREVEENDKNDFFSAHIFVTQFYQKFDLRTTLLYICERHFQKISNRSLFTGLQSITHFGRPDFDTFLASLRDEHPGVAKFGVFSCGPPPMTRSVEDACSTLNKDRAQGEAAFLHHYENF